MDAVLLVSTSSSSDNCSFPLKKIGMFKLHISKQASAVYQSPYNHYHITRLRKIVKATHLCYFLVGYMTPYRQEINVTIPLGAIPTRPLAVLWLLYDEYICDRARNEEGISINNSVQSIMIGVAG